MPVVLLYVSCVTYPKRIHEAVDGASSRRMFTVKVAFCGWIRVGRQTDRLFAICLSASDWSKQHRMRLVVGGSGNLFKEIGWHVEVVV